MVRWLDYLWSISDGPVIYPHAVWGAKGFTFGDWLQPVGDNRKPRPTIGDDCAATIYHYISTDLTARIAGILGRDDIAAQMQGRAARIKAAFAHEFVTASGRLAHNDQTSYALAFLHGLVPDEHQAAARAHFRRVIEDAGALIGTGFIGTPDLLPALSREGMHDLAGRVFLNEEVPGWLYQVRMGATTIWERWDALGPDGTIYDPDMNSYNHYAYGAVCQWLFEGVAGLRRDPDRPGFAGLLLDPVVIPDLGHVDAWHDSPKGRIAAGWRIAEGRVTYSVTLPEGCSAAFETRGRSGLTIDGAAPSGARLGPGRHEITFDLQGG
jgi:alpha-L-rhamnosidase